MRPARSTERTMFSGLVSRTSFLSFGNCTGIDVVTTGIVIRKMIKRTSITSTRGVVLMAETISSSSPPAEPTFIAMALALVGGSRSAQENCVQVRAETADLVHGGLVATDQPVVPEHRRHR